MTFDGEGIKIWWGWEITSGEFFRVGGGWAGGVQIFGWWGGLLPIHPSKENPVL